MFLFDLVTPLTIEGAKEVVKTRKGVEEDSWHGSDNAWSSDNNEMSSGNNQWTSEGVGPESNPADSTSPIHGMSETKLRVGDPVIVTGPNACEGKTGEIAEFSPSGKFVIVRLYNGGEHSMHLSDVEYNQYADDEDADEPGVAEGWSDAIVAQRTGQPRTPYSVYIKGKKWRDFENDDHAEAVANKLRAKFKAEGRDPSVITIAPTDYDKDLKEFAPTGNYKPPIIPREPGKEPFEDDPRSKTVSKVQQLLDAGKSVFVLLPGAKGRAISTKIGDDHSWLNVQYKGWQDPKTRSRSRLTVNLKADDDASLTLTPGSKFTDNKGRPFDYTLSGRADTGRGLGMFGMEEAGNLAQQAAIAIAKKKEQGVAEVKQRLDAKCWAGKHKEGTKIKGGVRVNNCVPNESVEEALSRKDLVKQVGDKLNDPEFRKKLADPTKRWEKGDLYQGPGQDDYGYTGYQGHGMPRDNPKKKKGVKEGQWNYPKSMTTIPKFDKEADDYLGTHKGAKFARKNKEDRKEWRKAQKAQAHKELMTGKQGVAESTNYWTKLQNERSTKLNSLVNELKESVKK